MEQQLLTSLLQTYGATGAVLIAAGWALKHLMMRYSEVQEKRIQEAQGYAAKLLEFSNLQHQQMQLLARALDGNADAVRDIKNGIETMVDTMSTLSMNQAPSGATGRFMPPTRRRDP